jgi:hypothetical protein
MHAMRIAFAVLVLVCTAIAPVRPAKLAVAREAEHEDHEHGVSIHHRLRARAHRRRSEVLRGAESDQQVSRAIGSDIALRDAEKATLPTKNAIAVYTQAMSMVNQKEAYSWQAWPSITSMLSPLQVVLDLKNKGQGKVFTLGTNGISALNCAEAIILAALRANKLTIKAALALITNARADLKASYKQFLLDGDKKYTRYWTRLTANPEQGDVVLFWNDEAHYMGHVALATGTGKDVITFGENGSPESGKRLCVDKVVGEVTDTSLGSQTLKCQGSATIQFIAVMFGTPKGDCNNPNAISNDNNCRSLYANKNYNDRCIGKTSCTIDFRRDDSGVPITQKDAGLQNCSKAQKRLVAVAQCYDKEKYKVTSIDTILSTLQKRHPKNTFVVYWGPPKWA